MFRLCRFWQDTSPTSLLVVRQEFQGTYSINFNHMKFGSENSKKLTAITSTPVMTPLYHFTFDFFAEAISVADVHSPFDLLSETLSIHT